MTIHDYSFDIPVFEEESLTARARRRLAHTVTMHDGRLRILPWRHDRSCTCEAHHTFICRGCGRIVGWCLGAGDNMPDYCDECWKPELD